MHTMYRKLEEIAAALMELEAAYNASPVGLAVLDTETRYRRINPRLAAMNGIPADAHIGKTVGELLPAFDAFAKALMREIVETGQPKTDIEISGETPQQPGVTRTWCEQWAPVRDASGKVVGVAISVEEITERKRVEAELAASRQELQHRVSELETLMASTPAAILVAHDAQCAHITGNHEAEEMFGFAPQQRITATVFDAFESTPFPGETGGKLLSVQDLPMETAGRTANPVRNAELTLRFKDGTEKNIVGSAHPLFNPDGTVRGVIGAFADITARKRAERQLAKEMHNKDAFLATLSHEMRNPLSAISSGIAVLQARSRSFPELHDIVTMLKRQQEQLTRLVDDLLDISRIGRGQISLQLTSVDVNQCIREAMTATRSLVTAKRQHVTYAPLSADVTLNGDAMRITQIVTNLLHNANKFSPEGAHIHVEAAHQSGRIVITVADEGPGIAVDLLPHIFDQFFKTGSGGSNQGLGIGLWLSRELAQLHGGTIRAANRIPGPGALFTVELPIRS